MKKEVALGVPAIMPIPSLAVTCRDAQGKNNAFAVGFAANISTSPAQLMITVLPSNYSYEVIKQTKQFAVNLVPKDFGEKYFYLGTHSARDEDKFAALDLAWTEGSKIAVALLDACPISVECTLTNVVSTGGDHDLFIGNVEAVHCDETWLDAEGNLDMAKVSLM